MTTPLQGWLDDMEIYEAAVDLVGELADREVERERKADADGLVAEGPDD